MYLKVLGVLSVVQSLVTLPAFHGKEQGLGPEPIPTGYIFFEVFVVHSK